MMKEMEVEYFIIKMEINMMVIGRMVKEKEKGFYILMMVKNTKVIL